MTTLDTVDPRASAALEPSARERLETLCAQLAADPIQIRVLMPRPDSSAGDRLTQRIRRVCLGRLWTTPSGAPYW